MQTVFEWLIVAWSGADALDGIQMTGAEFQFRSNGENNVWETPKLIVFFFFKIRRATNLKFIFEFEISLRIIRTCDFKGTNSNDEKLFA